METIPYLKKGDQWPRNDDLPRLAKYKRMRKIFEGKSHEVFDRAQSLLADTPMAPQLETLYIAANVMDVLITKPADMMVGKGFTVESGMPDDSREQQAVNSIIEENDINKLVYETILASGITGDAWLKTYYSTRQDVSIYKELGLSMPKQVGGFEALIESVPSDQVFPELRAGSRKNFRAVNLASIEFVDENRGFLGKKKIETPYLNVERHLPGYIIYERYELVNRSVDANYGAPIALFTVKAQVDTGRATGDVVSTGCAEILVRHAPYKASNDCWQGIGGIEKLQDVLAAINDRLTQIDYILWKHADPVAYGPEVNDGSSAMRFGGVYIPIQKDTDVVPGYMTWNSQLEGAFKELDYLLSLVFQLSETPQWLFGSNITQDKGGTGTSHSDGRAIKMRLLPIESKVDRIKLYLEPALRDVIWLAQELEVYANRGVTPFNPYAPVYPTIQWNDPIPRDEKELAEIMLIRTGGRATIDVHSAIKRQDQVDDMQARETASRIAVDEKNEALSQPSVYNDTPFGQVDD